MDYSKHDMVLMILDYLYNNNLIDSLITLENETNISLFSYNKEISFLRKLIIDGIWDEVINFLSPLKENKNFNFQLANYYIRFQEFFEASENNDNISKETLESKLLNLKKACNKEQFNEVVNIFQKNSIKEIEKYKNWSVFTGRYNTFKKIRELMNQIYPINEENEKKLEKDLLKKCMEKISGSENYNKGNIINPINDFINKKEDKEKSAFDLRNINYNIEDTSKLNDDNNHNLDISDSTGNLQELYSMLNKRKIEREKEKEKNRITQFNAYKQVKQIKDTKIEIEAKPKKK
jgi:hypothetical protein